MVRAPCCDKMGLKKGPWSAEEDQILVSHINKHGHGNWRALPKKAGLLRCGKSCRLRWTNYLRPDIKRGNFTREEEETIINLHEQLGNRWSAIAAQLPGRTDNEIKNIWHTYLKKRLNSSTPHAQGKKNKSQCKPTVIMESESMIYDSNSTTDCSSQPETSSEFSCCEIDSISTVVAKDEYVDFSSVELPVIDESVWFEELPVDDSADFGESAMTSLWTMEESLFTNTPPDEDDMDFWMRVLIEAEQLPEV